jgi:hypothetical protein
VTVLRRKSSDKAAAAAPTPTSLQRKPKADLYTVFLVIALVAVLVGILFLFLEMQAYEFKLQGAPPVGMVSPWSAQGTLAGVFLIPNP